MLRFKEKYKKEVVKKMMKEFGFKNVMLVPKIEKVVVNVGFGRMVSGKSLSDRKKIWESIIKDLSIICGQKAKLTKAKKSISTFKVREGMNVGAMTTLRGNMMYDFIERLVHVVFPRTRDFQGINPNSIDQNGNLNIGIKEHITFPEISTERLKDIFGLEVNVTTSAKNKKQGLRLLELLGFPLKVEKSKK